jgi:2-hydroxy-3-oxopropionate reductase
MMQVAVIGIGVMGSAIAGRLLDCGDTVHLYDPVGEKCTPLAKRGARMAVSASRAAQSAQFIITCLNSADVVERAVFGPDGIATAASPDKLLIDMSSIDPERASSMSMKLLASAGMGWVDAPLSGGAPAAEKGALTLMLGGTDVDIARATPVLSKLAARYTHFGAVGAGQTVKLINQVLCANAFLAVAEAVRFAEAHGVDATRIPEALAGGRADSRILQEFMAKMARRDFSPTGRIDNMLKDLETVQVAALARRVPMPVTSLITDLHRILIAGGFGPGDTAEYMRLFDLASGRPK